MEMEDRMKELTQDILSSSEKRAEELTKLKGETNTLRQEAANTVKDLSVSRGETNRQLKKDLAQSNTSRKMDTRGLIQDFQDSRRKSGEKMRKELAQGSKLLVQNEKKRKQDVGKMLEVFQSSHKESGAELRKELSEAKAKTILEVKEALVDARSLINGYQSSRQTMRAELKKDLGKSRDAMKADVEGMRSGFRQAQAEVQADLKGAAGAWQEMGSVMRKQTSVGKPAPAVQAEIPVEISLNMIEKLLEIINQHAEGITLSEVAKELGIVTIVLGKAAKVLLEQGKVRKEDKIYFPVTP
jgi:hypothetical protein